MQDQVSTKSVAVNASGTGNGRGNGVPVAKKSVPSAAASPAPKATRSQESRPGRSPRRLASSTAQRILVVEDDRNIGGGLRRALEGEGYVVEWVTDGASALESAARLPADLVVLDLYLPDMDGVDVCHRLRQAFPALPIMILSARTDEIDIVVGLDAGADDYLVKPFRLAELLARLRAHLRRPRPGTAPQRLAAGDLHIDLDARRVFVAGGGEVSVRPKELELLSLLVAEAGRAISRERIMREVWGVETGSSTKTLDMHVSTLRRKLLDAGSSTRVTTIRGAGYRLDP